jgi:hypothetical protein
MLTARAAMARFAVDADIVDEIAHDCIGRQM